MAGQQAGSETTVATKKAVSVNRRGGDIAGTNRGDKMEIRTSTGSWKIPRGNDARTVTRDAGRQVIKNYGEALDKLRKK